MTSLLRHLPLALPAARRTRTARLMSRLQWLFGSRFVLGAALPRPPFILLPVDKQTRALQSETAVSCALILVEEHVNRCGESVQNTNRRAHAGNIAQGDKRCTVLVSHCTFTFLDVFPSG